MTKQKNTPVLIVLFVLLLVGLLVLIYNFRISADIPVANYQSDVKLKQVPVFDYSPESDAQTVEISIPKGEEESFSILFKNESSKNYSNLTVSKSDLVSSANEVVNKKFIDERVVHTWPQKIVDWEAGKITSLPNPIDVDELLVRNDKTNFFLSDNSGPIGTAAGQLLTSGGSTQNQSSDGLSEPINISVSANANKKFVFTVRAPLVGAGSYSGKVDFVDASTNQAISYFNLKLNVLDFDLVSPSQADTPYTIGCYINDRIKTSKMPTNSQHWFISEDLFQKRLQTVHDYGCNSVVLRVGPFANNTKALELLSQDGFAGPAVLNYDYIDSNGGVLTGDLIDTPASQEAFKKIVTDIKNDPKITIPILFYGVDEPNSVNGTAEDKYENNKTRVRNIKSIVAGVLGADAGKSNIGNEVTTSALWMTFERLFADGDEYKTNMPIVNYRRTLNSEQGQDFLARSALYRSGQATPLPEEVYYFQGWNELRDKHGTRAIDRYLGGLGLIGSGYRGYIVNPVYGYSGTSQRPLYDDFQIASWNKQMMVFYPAVDGFIPTLQSESWREGILDLKYYLTYKEAKKLVNSQCSAQTKNDLATVGSGIENKILKYNTIVSNYLLPPSLSDSEMDETRSLLKQYLEKFYSSCTSCQINIDKGLSTFGSMNSLNSRDLINEEGSSFLKYSGVDMKWFKSITDPFVMKPGEGYYVYNGGNAAKSVNVNAKTESSASRTLSEGWNVLWSPYTSGLSDIKVSISAGEGTNRCSKLMSLQEIVNRGKASKVVYIIKDGSAVEAKNAFKLLGFVDDANHLSKVPAGKAFWFYVRPKADALNPNNSAYSDIGCL